MYFAGWQQNRQSSKVHLIVASRQVTYEEGAEFANQNGLLFVECSAKTGYNVDSVF